MHIISDNTLLCSRPSTASYTNSMAMNVAQTIVELAEAQYKEEEKIRIARELKESKLYIKSHRYLIQADTQVGHAGSNTWMWVGFSKDGTMEVATGGVYSFADQIVRIQPSSINRFSINFVRSIRHKLLGEHVFDDTPVAELQGRKHVRITLYRGVVRDEQLALLGYQILSEMFQTYDSAALVDEVNALVQTAQQIV